MDYKYMYVCIKALYVHLLAIKTKHATRYAHLALLIGLSNS